LLILIEGEIDSARMGLKSGAAFVVQTPGPMLIVGDGPINGDVGKLPESQAGDLRVGENGQVVHLHQKTSSFGIIWRNHSSFDN
jgi:hypothetical protein